MASELERLYTWGLDAFSIFFRYFLFAGMTYFIFYFWRSKAYQNIKIQQTFPSSQIVSKEILFSLSTLVIHCIASWFAFYWWKSGITKVYLEIEQFGWFYFVLSIFIMVLIHDAYFYWTHRLIHLPKIYKIVHQTHHHSVNPTPWASFAFHPIEAIISTGIIPIYLFLMPIHPIALFVFLTIMTLVNVMGHLGYETFSLKFRRSRIGKWQNTSTNHNIHHQNTRVNFGLYFTFWDKLMNTYRATDP